MQFALLLAPIVMNGFLLVYALTGWTLEGRARLNWSLEAGSVAFWVGLGMVAYGASVIVLTRLAGGAWRHPLILSGAAHALLALALGVSVVVAARV